MNLIETCMQEQQNLEQDGRKFPEESGMQDVQVGAGVEGRQDVQAEEPAETSDEAQVETETLGVQAEEAEAPADGPHNGLQDGRQNPPADDSAEGRNAPKEAGAEAPEAQAGSVTRFLPPKREKTIMENVTVRLRPAVKKAARALAHERGMSLSEFCAAVIDNVVREAGGEQAA